MLLVNKYWNNIASDEYNQSLNQINALNIIQLLTYNRLLRQDKNILGVMSSFLGLVVS